MTVASEAIDIIADATGFLPATVFRVARALREADPELWPMGSAGRGQAALIYPRHLAAIIVGLLASGTANEAPEVVTRWLTLPLSQKLLDDVFFSEDIQGATFGDLLTSIIDFLSEENAELLSEQMKKAVFSISLDWNDGHKPTRLRGRANHLMGDLFLHISSSYSSNENELTPPQCPVAVTKRISVDMLKLLASLWANTRATLALQKAPAGLKAKKLPKRNPENSAPAPGSADGETTKAAGTGIHDGLLDDQPKTQASVGGTHAIVGAGDGETQSSSSSQADRPPQPSHRKGSRRHAERKHSTRPPAS